MWVGDRTNWQHKSEIILRNVKAIAPTAVRYDNKNIDIFCVNFAD